MNKYFTNLRKIEFAVTDACTGRCIHCSEGHHPSCGTKIDPDLAAEAVIRITDKYNIKTVMAFGGEPLLHKEAVFSIMKAARDKGVPVRQVITNGYFSKDIEIIKSVVQELALSGVNDLLLSVDAFHQKDIPLNTVMQFAKEAKEHAIPIRLSPAWLVNREDNNPYNLKTREILDSFSEYDIDIGEGNVVFPEGNALKYLSDYFMTERPKNPYVEDPCDIKCISISANGDVLSDNIYSHDILEIIENYSF